jgi:hypothetical protein
MRPKPLKSVVAFDGACLKLRRQGKHWVCAPSKPKKQAQRFPRYTRKRS